MARRRGRKRQVDPAPFDCEVVDLASDGRGVARVEGKVVFVADALPGERVRARRVASGAAADEAQMVDVLTPSADRVVPRCAHFGVCGGCVLQHLAPTRQQHFKQKQLEDALWRIGRVVPQELAPPLAAAEWGYRRRARLGVKYVHGKGRTLVGFRERHAPFLAEIDSCEVLDPRIGQRLRVIGAMIDGLSIRSAIPQIEVTATDRVALVFRVLETPSAQDLETLRAFAQAEQFDIWLQSGGPATVTPLDPVPLPKFSPDGSGMRLELAPTDFIQVNTALSQAMVRQAIDWMAPVAGSRVLELFAGLGNFTAPLAAAGALVTAVEGEPGLVARGRCNTQAADVDVDWHVADLYAEGDADARLLAEPWAQQEYDAALIDPPRAGAREVLALLAARGIRTLLYVSCHPATLARDAGILTQEHGFTLARAGVMDMFPHTAHIEAMALFRR